MKRNAQYETDLSAQVDGMLAAASRRHPSFVDDCMTSLDRLVDHWADDVSVEFVDDSDGDAVDTVQSSDADRSGISETIRKLSGLFVPPIGGEPARIRIRSPKGDFPAHGNFTLLHEFGHLLQQTEDELAFRLIRIGGLSYDRIFEEEACNRFAARALLPDVYLDRFFADGITAGALATIYDDLRASGIARASRPALARRVAPLLGDGGTVTVIDDSGLLRIRAYGDGHCEYPSKDKDAPGSSSLVPVETDMLQRLRDAEKDRKKGKSFGLSIPGTEQGTVTCAFSYSGWNRPFAFVVVPKAEPSDSSD